MLRRAGRGEIECASYQRFTTPCGIFTEVAMSLRRGRQSPLRDITRDLADSDPRLEVLFCSFNLQFSGAKMPRTEKIRTGPRAWIARIGRRMCPVAADFQGLAVWHQ
jgi:hypothetical protein